MWTAYTNFTWISSELSETMTAEMLVWDKSVTLKKGQGIKHYGLVASLIISSLKEIGL